MMAFSSAGFAKKIDGGVASRFSYDTTASNFNGLFELFVHVDEGWNSLGEFVWLPDLDLNIYD